MNKHCCNNMLQDVVSHSGTLCVPPFMQHLIDLPMKHVPLPSEGFYTRGYVTMKFNGQTFRRDIYVRDTEPCPTCGRDLMKDDDFKDLYLKELQSAMRVVSLWVNKEVKELMLPWIDKVDKASSVPMTIHIEGRK